MWTNSTLRKHLGERGFFEEGPPLYESVNVRQTRWHRDGEELLLTESINEGGAGPSLTFNGQAIAPEIIGWRNTNTQTGNRA